MELDALVQRLVPKLKPWFLSLQGGYEEGIWTPSYIGSTTLGGGSTTYSARTGQYVRIGQLVWFSLSLWWTATTEAGNALITLPLQAAATGGRAVIPVLPAFATFANGSIVGSIDNGATTISLISPKTGDAATTVIIEQDGFLYVSGCYRVQ